jgi:hypothetical protein
VSEAVRARDAQRHRAPSGVIHMQVRNGHLHYRLCVNAEELRVVLEHSCSDDWADSRDANVDRRGRDSHAGVFVQSRSEDGGVSS